MILQQRINYLRKLADYMRSDDPRWLDARDKASRENGWFIPPFVDLAVSNIVTHFLDGKLLDDWSLKYDVPTDNNKSRTVGIVMAGNIPLVGFHDFLSVFISGHSSVIKASSKDDVLLRHLVDTLRSWDSGFDPLVRFADLLKNMDAYIATGSNNTSRYFEYYFGKYAHLIRPTRTSVAVLSGHETKPELEGLADDVYQFFGLGCRSVTKLYVPPDYNFVPLLEAFRKYDFLAAHHKYKNNYDYNLAIHLLNKKYYMSNSSLLLIQENSLFSPISQLNYEYYTELSSLATSLQNHPEIQCIVGQGQLPFGQSQSPGLFDYADGVDTMAFLKSL